MDFVPWPLVVFACACVALAIWIHLDAARVRKATRYDAQAMNDTDRDDFDHDEGDRMPPEVERLVDRFLGYLHRIAHSLEGIHVNTAKIASAADAEVEELGQISASLDTVSTGIADLQKTIVDLTDKLTGNGSTVPPQVQTALDALRDKAKAIAAALPPPSTDSPTDSPTGSTGTGSTGDTGTGAIGSGGLFGGTGGSTSVGGLSGSDMPGSGSAGT